MIQDSAKTILCYGDSNTWGNVPRSDSRYPRSVRWPGALQNLLGDAYEVISEGLCGRTFVALQPDKQHRAGLVHFRALLESHDPLDLVIVMLGTNDVKTTFGLSAEDIAADLEETVAMIKGEKTELTKVPKILIICPPPVIHPSVPAKSKEGKELDERMLPGLALFKTLPKLYEIVAKRYGCDFLNAGDYISSSKIDGYHLDKEAHLKLAEILKERIQKLDL